MKREGKQNEKYIMGIDQGTTGTRAIIFDHDVNVVAQAYTEFKQYFPKPGWVEHDAQEIFDETVRMMRMAVKQAAIDPEEIAAIGITNQRVTTVFWDKNTGEPADHAIVWQDRRSLPICEELIEKDGDAIRERTGMQIIPNASATKIAWQLRNNPEIKRGVDEGRLIFGTIDTWLIWKLSGGAAHVSEVSNLTETLLLNEITLDYDDAVLKLLDIPRSILPEIKSTAEVYAETTPDIFGGIRIPIASAVGDQQAAALGQACFEPGMAKNTYGTGSFMNMNVGDRYIKPANRIIACAMWDIAGQVKFGLEGLVDVSGSAIQWLRDGLGIIEKSSDAEKLALRVENNGGVFFVPAFVGLGAPHFDSYARGTIVGITRGTTKHHIARATLESMAYQVADAFGNMSKTAGIPIKTLRADGGGAKSGYMLQFQADILGVPVERPEITETTCLGVVYAAGLAIGFWESMDEIARFWKLDKLFEPSISADERQQRLYDWQCAVKRAGGWMKR